MRNIVILSLFIVLNFVAVGQCTDPNACNFGQTFMFDDGNCYYESDLCNHLTGSSILEVFGSSCNCTPVGPGDFNADEWVSSSDLTIFLGFFGPLGSQHGLYFMGDFNNSGSVTASDLTAFLTVYGQHVPY